LSRKIYADTEGNIRKTKDEGLARKDQVDMARLRCGHHPELLYWLKIIEKTEDETCRLCNLHPETADHVLTGCPGVQDYYPPGWSLKDLLNEPGRTLSIWRTGLSRRDEETEETTATTIN
jgi:hypothetical protein